MAMRDVGNMAHVEKFSNIIIPMLWFEIVSKAHTPKKKTTKNFNVQKDLSDPYNRICIET